jgi:predicted Na+-dependent transporter
VGGSDAVSGGQARLAQVGGFLDRFLLPLVLISAGLGVTFPGPGRRLDANGAILITLAVLVFCTGSSVTFADINSMRGASRRMVLVLAATTTILPLLAWLASRLVSEPALRGGVLAAGVAPWKWHPWRSPGWPAARSWWQRAC